MNYLLFILHLSLATWMISRLKWMQVPGIKPVWTASYFILKCFLGLLLGYIYQHYYGFGDTLRYVKDADLLFKFGKENPKNFIHLMTGIGGDAKTLDIFRHQLELWYDSGFDSYYNDNRTIIRINVLIRFISFGYYEVHVVWMNVLAFLGLSWLYKTFYYADENTKENNQLAKSTTPSLLFLIPFFLPNVLIWGSGVLKEPLLLFVLGALFRTFQLVVNRGLKSDYVKLLAVLFIFLFIKLYLLLILVPGLFAIYLIRSLKSEKPLLIFSLSYLIFSLSIFLAGNFIPTLDLPALLFGKQLNMWKFAIYSHAGTIVHPIPFAPSVLSFLKHFPEAVGYSMFRPYPWELKQWWMIPLALESLIIPFIVLLLVFRKDIKSISKSPYALLALFASVALYALVGFTTPVLGSLVRYKMPAVLLFMLAFCCVEKNNRIKKPG